MDLTSVSLRQLQVLKAVADNGSMAQAGRQLFMTGPAVTQQIQQLEKRSAHRLSTASGADCASPALENARWPPPTTFTRD